MSVQVLSLKVQFNELQSIVHVVSYELYVELDPLNQILSSPPFDSTVQEEDISISYHHLRSFTLIFLANYLGYYYYFLLMKIYTLLNESPENIKLETLETWKISTP